MNDLHLPGQLGDTGRRDLGPLETRSWAPSPYMAIPHEHHAVLLGLDAVEMFIVAEKGATLLFRLDPCTCWIAQGVPAQANPAASQSRCVALHVTPALGSPHFKLHPLHAAASPCIFLCFSRHPNATEARSGITRAHPSRG